MSSSAVLVLGPQSLLTLCPGRNCCLRTFHSSQVRSQDHCGCGRFLQLVSLRLGVGCRIRTLRLAGPWLCLDGQQLGWPSLGLRTWWPLLVDSPWWSFCACLVALARDLLALTGEFGGFAWCLGDFHCGPGGPCCRLFGCGWGFVGSNWGLGGPRCRLGGCG